MSRAWPLTGLLSQLLFLHELIPPLQALLRMLVLLGRAFGRGCSDLGGYCPL